jgi:sporulation-control protein spo0M
MFKRLTQFIGMVDIDVTVEVETSYPKDATRIEGIIRIAAEQDQTISKIDIQVTQRQEEGNVGDSDRKIKHKPIGTVTLRQAFDIKKGETKNIPFALDFKRELSLTRKMSEQGGLMGMIGKAYTAADNERWQFWVEAVVDVKGAAIDPTGSTQVFFGN